MRPRQRACGHRVRAMTPEEFAAAEARLVAAVRQAREHRDVAWYQSAARLTSRCALGHCHRRIAFCVTYVYVTGQARRVTTSRKFACHLHAARFAAAHHCVLPADPPAADTGCPPRFDMLDARS